MSHPIKHFKTITKHRHKVITHCFKVGIGFQGLFHDLTKYSFVEFVPGAKYYQGNRSPNEQERELFGYSAAWMHHKGRNRHHFEYWTDLNINSKRYEPVPMPVRFVKEMFCDRVAASKIYQGDKYTNAHPLAYFLKGDARGRMHQYTADLLQCWLEMLAEKGEAIAFAHIRSIGNNTSYKELSIEKDSI